MGSRTRKGRCLYRFFTAMTIVLMLLCTSLVLSSCGKKPGLGKDLEKKLSDVVEKDLRQYGVPGAIVGIWWGDKEWVETFGKSDIKTGTAMQTEDRYRIGSQTKTFTASVVLELVDEGKLGLDDKVSKFEPWVPNGDNITVRMLLNHTSGLHDPVKDMEYELELIKQPLKKWAPREVAQAGIDRPPYFAPGEGYKYSNTNYVLLGMIVEKVTGKTLPAEIRTRFIDRYGLKNTTFDVTPDVHGKHSHGYTYTETSDGPVDITRLDPSVAWAAGAMVSDLTDMKAWAKILAEGKFLKPETREERAGYSKASDISEYGLGIEKIGDLLGHTGGIFGFNTASFYDPGTDMTIVLQANLFLGKDASAPGSAILVDILQTLAGSTKGP